MYFFQVTCNKSLPMSFSPFKQQKKKKIEAKIYSDINNSPHTSGLALTPLRLKIPSHSQRLAKLLSHNTKSKTLFLRDSQDRSSGNVPPEGLKIKLEENESS